MSAVISKPEVLSQDETVTHRFSPKKQSFTTQMIQNFDQIKPSTLLNLIPEQIEENKKSKRNRRPGFKYFNYLRYIIVFLMFFTIFNTLIIFIRSCIVISKVLEYIIYTNCFLLMSILLISMRVLHLYLTADTHPPPSIIRCAASKRNEETGDYLINCNKCGRQITPKESRSSLIFMYLEIIFISASLSIICCLLGYCLLPDPGEKSHYLLIFRIIFFCNLCQCLCVFLLALDIVKNSSVHPLDLINSIES
ncbi:hypothetical protein TBLA_0B00720 [Henningerozyma blattae CBS 6284]|uniref:Uncharacterized protein n=1 Tax=Henningerozyma blattae (strain ATCC 34711 / CBS 6284 / DSM 70876 / NBRC 10599 / NRRL Y-10934 / UCD 77-7) TaxID=1071380 RepID=I2GXR3_HENB6|nr:hypothetical protein TBLA_0B00720 [Tetrapisispora blattae CBS 6284]CCH58915.1 hypothetical protein TBLA_0B00720 [Tetrapisispora blattae CBS 6284]